MTLPARYLSQRKLRSLNQCSHAALFAKTSEISRKPVTEVDHGRCQLAFREEAPSGTAGLRPQMPADAVGLHFWAEQTHALIVNHRAARLDLDTDDVVVIERAGLFPWKDAPERYWPLLIDFVTSRSID